jgi:DNA-binding transcriptional ArsR family regulator/uncharacterized protein YndB with AHSA1/START domain
VTKSKTDLDLAWRALADPTRREILDQLAGGPATTGEIEARFPMTRIAVMKHLKLLSEAGLLSARKIGRQRWHYLNGHALNHLAERWLSPLSRRWASGLDRLQNLSEGTADAMTGKPDIDIAQDISIAAPPDNVFSALTAQIGEWWGAPYLAGNAIDMTLDASLGGSFCEVWPDDGGRLLGTVTAINRPHLIEISGPFHFGLVHGIAEFRLDADDGGTLLKFTHRAIGLVDAGYADAAQNGWRELLDNRLRRFVETGERLGIAARSLGEGTK